MASHSSHVDLDALRMLAHRRHSKDLLARRYHLLHCCDILRSLDPRPVDYMFGQTTRTVTVTLLLAQLRQATCALLPEGNNWHGSYSESIWVITVLKPSQLYTSPNSSLKSIFVLTPLLLVCCNIFLGPRNAGFADLKFYVINDHPHQHISVKYSIAPSPHKGTQLCSPHHEGTGPPLSPRRGGVLSKTAERSEAARQPIGG